MFTVPISMEALASRAVRSRHAHATVSRVLARPLRRTFIISRSARLPTPMTSILPDADNMSDVKTFDNRGLTWDDGSTSTASSPRAVSQSPRTDGPVNFKTPTIEEPGIEVETPLSPNASTRGLLKALQQGNARKIHTCLRHLTSSTNTGEAMRAEVARLPQTAFSELLRCLDPLAIERELNGAQDVAIGPGLAQYTSLGALVDKFGIKILYVQLQKCLTALTALRRETGHELLMSDYNILMRCAGAASDIIAAQRLQEEMVAYEQMDWWQAETYNEFCKARFLTEPLYIQHNLAQFRVRPRNLHRSKVILPPEQVLQLDRLRTAIFRRQVHRFGQNPNELHYAEHLTRLLRGVKPIERAYAMAKSFGAMIDENLLCTFMIAHARTGGLQALQMTLEVYWGIEIHRNKKTGDTEISGGRTIPPDSPLRPSSRLLDTIVHSFCCNGEVTMALRLVDFVSTQYQLQVQNRTWSTLLEWTHILSSKQVAWEWQTAQFPQKVMTGSAVRLIWDTMTSEPYNYNPGIKEYNILIQNLIAQKDLARVMRIMRDLRHLYDSAVRENENALFELVQTLGQEVEASLAKQRYRAAQTRKARTWHCFNLWCMRLLKRIRATRIDDDMVVRAIPIFIHEFRQFMPPRISYRTATGYVDFKSENLAAIIPKSRGTFELPAQGFRLSNNNPGLDSLSVNPWTSQQRALLARGPRKRSAWVRQPQSRAPDLLSRPAALSPKWLEREFT